MTDFNDWSHLIQNFLAYNYIWPILFFYPILVNSNQLNCTYIAYIHADKLTKTHTLLGGNCSIAGSNTSWKRKEIASLTFLRLNLEYQNMYIKWREEHMNIWSKSAFFK